MKSVIFLLTTVLMLSPSPSSFAADAGVSELAAAYNTFAFKLLKELNTETESGNLFVSPYSAATALQMVANGAAGQTKAEMESVLATSGLSQETLNVASKAVANLLNAPDTNVILSTANALWYRQSAQIKPEFLAENQRYFGSTIKPLDFGNVPAAEAEINQWASDQTHGRITGIANGMIDPHFTDLVLANAIYFKGKWRDPFDKELTKERPFHAGNGTSKKVPMMEMSSDFTYRKGTGYQAVRLPYMGGDVVMYVFLPDPNFSPTKLLQIMNGDSWRRVTVPGFTIHKGLLVLPKVKLENTFDLVPTLKALGMKLAFNNLKSKPDPDFSGMFKDPHFISEVRQNTFVEVGEEGTEAAAVTAITMAPSAIIMNPPKPFEMIVDRPFLFAIVDVRSEMILFMGVVNDL